MKSTENLPIKERITKKRHQNCSYKICAKNHFLSKFRYGEGGKDQFIFVKHKNVPN